MPIYEYVCEQCRKEQEILVRGQEAPHCQGCGSDQLVKLLSVPAAHAANSTQGAPRDLPPAGPCQAGGCGCFPGG
jgi:putative FmdB family regulatory protein